MSVSPRVCFLLLILLLPAMQAQAANPEHGAAVFEAQCAECHSSKPGKNKKGPSLFGVVGRASAQVADYVYSDAMKGSGLTWSASNLNAYAANPRKVVHGGKMKYDGLDDETERSDLIEFLTTLH